MLLPKIKAKHLIALRFYFKCIVMLKSSKEHYSCYEQRRQT